MDPQGRLLGTTEHSDPILVAQFLSATLKILLIFMLLMTEQRNSYSNHPSLILLVVSSS